MYSNKILYLSLSTMRKAIAYYRVSTDRQGKSGLVLEAQANAVDLQQYTGDFFQAAI